MARSMVRGKFIVIEGPDCCGKGTLIKLLKAKLGTDKFVFTREPGGLNNNTTESIRNVLLNTDNDMLPVTEAYLYAASRAEHVNKINELLDKGINVICERYIQSSLVYQGLVRGLGISIVREINHHAIKNLNPDLIIFLTIDIETYLSRIDTRGLKDRIESEDQEFFQHVIDAYKYLYEKYHFHNSIIVDTKDNNPDKVCKIALKHIELII